MEGFYLLSALRCDISTLTGYEVSYPGYRYKGRCFYYPISAFDKLPLNIYYTPACPGEKCRPVFPDGGAFTFCLAQQENDNTRRICVFCEPARILLLLFVGVRWIRITRIFK